MSNSKAEAEKQPWRYILSAGRTGTLFLASYLESRCTCVTAVHEPRPSRQHLLLANIRNDTGFGKGFLAWHFQKCRLTRLRRQSGIYVEINPHLCALTDLLLDPDRPARIVHMVREPESWTASILGFKASAPFRKFIDLIPFATPYPAPRPEGWRSFAKAEKVLWRWHWCNSRILMLRDKVQHFCIIRYEDLFCSDDPRREAALASIGATLGLDGNMPIDSTAFFQRMNPGVSAARRPDPALVRRICGELALTLGYEL
jgi:hypothetical protein